jgi:hypothetical protein
VLPPFLEDASRRLEHDDHRGLVVGAEDRAGRVPNHAVLADAGVDRRLRRHRIRVCAEEDRCPSSIRRREAAVDVPGIAVETHGCVVLVPLQPELREVGGDSVGHRALLPRRARERTELEEEVDERRRQRLLHGPHPTADD